MNFYKVMDDEFIHLWIYEKSIHNILITKNESKWASNLSESRSQEYKLSRSLMRKSLSELFNLDPLSIPLDSKPGIAPQLPRKYGYVSLSHCKDAILVGWSKNQIGIDIERRDRKIKNSLKKFFNFPKEKIEDFHFENENDFFLSLWTAKESAIKWERSSIFSDFKNWNIENEFNIMRNKKTNISLELKNFLLKKWIISAVVKKNKEKIEVKVHIIE